MVFRKRMKEPKGMIPVAMMFLVIGILWPNLFHPASQSARNLSEGLRGMMFGISIAMSGWAAVLLRRRRECGRS